MSRYLITFDMDTNCLKDNYHGNSYNNAGKAQMFYLQSIVH